MEKKLSEIWLEQKGYNTRQSALDVPENIVLDLEEVKIYGKMTALEYIAMYHIRAGKQKIAKATLKEIAQEHGITGYKL